MPVAAGTPPCIGAVADDLTGATDLALTLARGGMRVTQIVGVPEPGAALPPADAIVVALKSRTAPVAEAVAQSTAAARALLAAGVAQFFFKYCSTFDSTPQGNIGPVIDALLNLLGAQHTLACPAFPANGRTVYKGHLFVGDRLLSDSSMKDHPLTPMRDADLVRVLAPQTTRPVRRVTIETVRSGAGALRDMLKRAEGIAIVDALGDDDLRTIGTAAASLRLVTGGSGVALGLPANFGFHGAGATGAHAPAPRGRRAVLAGSCSAATRRQVDTARAAGMPGLKLDPAAIADGSVTVAEALAFARAAADDDRVPVIYAGDDPEAVAASQARLGRARAGALVEQFLAALAAALADADFDRLIVAGGETSGAVIDGLGIRTFEIGAEVAAGVPWTHATRAGRPIALVLKSGNFGADDIFLEAWDRLA